MPGQTVRRSWLLIPAIRTDLIEQSWTFGADVIVFDLEDLVHDKRKHEARANVRAGALFTDVMLLGSDIVLMWRAVCEEQTLARDDAYRSYQQVVRWRVLPGVF